MMKNVKRLLRSVKFISCFCLLNILRLTGVELYAQVAFMGYDYQSSTYPLRWVLNPPVFNAGTNNEVRLNMADGNIQEGQICSPNNNRIEHYYLGGTTQMLEINIPQHSISQFMIEFTGSTNGGSTAKAGVVYSDKIPFDPNSCIGAEATPNFPANNGNWTKIQINPPTGTKSLRVYRRVFYGSGTMSTSSGSGRTQYGDNTSIRMASVAVWATATPTQQAHHITFSNTGTISTTVSFTRGSGTHVAVFAKEGTGSITNPVENTAYTASSDWREGSPTGTQLGSSGYFCVYNGTENSFTLNNLKPDTEYTFQAFEYTAAPSQIKYLTTTATDNPASVTTLPLSVPSIETAAVTDILSNKATVGSVNLYDGGLAITDKGFVWSTVTEPNLTNNTGRFSAGGGSSDFTDFIKGLTPETKYYVRAYAVNSMGVSYGNEQEFTTAAPAPVLVAIPGAIDFGEYYFGENALTISYNLSGQHLSPASGNITITAPPGFLVSLRGNTDFAQTITLPYSGGVIGNRPIYVQLPTTTYGSFSGNITHTGGGVAVADADIVKVLGTIIQSQEELTNRGTDFWLGFGFQERMDRKSGDAAEAKLSVYISAGEQPATVVVDLPGIPGATGFPRTVNVPANGIVEVTDFPTGDTGNNTNNGGFPDTRLYSTGISNKAIHVYSTNGAPIAAWMHTYANNNSAGGAMLFPSNTWSSEYIVQAYGGRTNQSSPPSSFFFVIANEDNTEIEFTPSNPIINADAASLFTSGHTTSQILYQAGQTYTITLNKGQIFNAMGFVQGSGSNSATGLDLTGTKIKTNCDKKIAVFGGNGRVLVTAPSCTSSSGSDNLIQQMFPTVAWGTKYLTAPTKNMENNLFRIVVNDPTTIVKRNGVVLNPATLINNLYYQVESNQPMMVESDKPVNVTQFILAGDCGNASTGNSGDGDPEMIILSPVQQAINKATVYSAHIKRSGATASNSGHYINVVIEKAAIENQSFQLDNIDFNSNTLVNIGGTAAYSNQNVLMRNAFTVHPQDPNYYYARFRVNPGQSHTISSNYNFNAIAYGMGNGESYGYNAGTAIKNLNSVKIAVNPEGVDTSSTSVRTGKNNPVTLRIALPHNPHLVDKIVWDSGTDPRISPTGSRDGEIDSATGKAKYEDTIEIDGRIFYIYNSPIEYQFSEEGISRITATALGTFASECGGEDVQRISVIVGRDNVNFDFSTSCGNPTVNFINNSTPMPGTTITKWAWDFGDGNTSDLQNPPAHTYNISGGYKYTAKLTTTNTVGTITTDSIEVDFSGGIEPHFSMSADTVCSGTTISFDSSLSQITGTTSGTPEKWIWDFGEGDKVEIAGAFSPIQQYTYNNPGKFAVKLTMVTSSSCENVYVDTVVVGASPESRITAQQQICIGEEIEYTDASIVSVGKVGSWLWTFDDGSTSTEQNPKHRWLTAGKHTVKLQVRSEEGCDAVNEAIHEVTVLPLPVADFVAELPMCAGSTIRFRDASVSQTTESTLTEWGWDFGDGSPYLVKSNADEVQHIYAQAGNYTVRLWVKSSGGCVSDTVSKTITINPLPELDFATPDICVTQGPVQFSGTNQQPSITITTWTWDFGDGNTATGQNPQYAYQSGGLYNITLTGKTANGCEISLSKEIKVYDAPTISFTIENETGLCSSSPVLLTNKSVVNGYGAISKVEIFWDYLDNPGVKQTDDNPVADRVYEHQYPDPSLATKSYRILIRAYTETDCYKEAYRDITIHAMPVAELAPLPAICANESAFYLTQGRDARNIPGNGVYSGKGITQSPEFSPQQAGPGIHRIKYTYTTVSGCVSEIEGDIEVYAMPDISAGRDVIYVKDKESVVLSPRVVGGNNLTYKWSPSTYLDNANIQTPTCRPLEDIVYTLEVVNENGCKDEIAITVNLLRELLPPNTFTPNGDGHNDIWEVQYLDTYPGASVEIFNRYGKRVFVSTLDKKTWDGKFNGEDLPVGTYYYIIDPKNGEELISGSVTIIR